MFLLYASDPTGLRLNVKSTTQMRKALKGCQRGVTFNDPGVACINDTQSSNKRR
jgi:hypothetical protein